MHVRFCTGGRKKEHGLRQAQAMLVQELSGSVRAGGRQAGVVGRSRGLNGAGAGLAQRLQLHAGIGAQAGLQLRRSGVEEPAAGVVAAEGIDTRALTRHIREAGATDVVSGPLSAEGIRRVVSPH